jgi:DNA helicase-2/ATP-dependent DNA helicase PcrA
MDLSHLNDPQRQAVVHGDAPLLVLAGAGTGKTSVITHRIAHLVEVRGVSPDRILAVTFTNKAAREMRERTSRLIGVAPRLLEIGTFHSLCGRMLRRDGDRLGLDANFLIYDADDQLQLIRRIAQELDIDPQAVAPRAMRLKIEAWKNAGLPPAEATASPLDVVAKRALQVYRVYQERCLAANAADFGDLLLHALTLLKAHPTVRERYQRRWTHLLVDEYQDTNPVQYMWLKQLVTDSHSLTVVGDDDQSIYRWRGADIGNILRFERDFPGAGVIRLEQNYRSTKTILAAANAVIAHNVARKGKTLFSAGATGDRLTLRLFDTERDEGNAVADAISTALADGHAPADVAVLYRTNAQSRPLEDALRRRRIPYVIYGGVRFYDRKEVKDALAYLRLLANPRSTLDFLRVVNVPPRGIGKTTLDRLADIAAEGGMSLLDAAASAIEHGTLAGKARTSLKGFLELLMGWRAGMERGASLGELLGRCLDESGYLAALRAEGSEESDDRIANLEELAAALDEYAALAEEPSLVGFLEEVSLSTDIDGMGLELGQVTLMTLHAAKGLEFPIVFLPGLEEGLFPHSRSLDDRAALEEERRLAYVGLTRAKEALHLSAARVRSIFGKPQLSELSRFVSEIPEELVEVTARTANPPLPQLGQRTFVPVGSMPTPEPQAPGDDLPVARTDGGTFTFPPGTRVLHATFGEGRVVGSDGAGTRQKLTIQFPKIGQKVIVARFVERL